MSYTNCHVKNKRVSFSDLTRFLIEHYHHHGSTGRERLGKAFCVRFAVVDPFLEFVSNDEEAIEDILTHYTKPKQYAYQSTWTGDGH